MHVVVVTGTRPQIIKTVPLLNALEDQGIEFTFIHTGQHYDYEMAKQFFDFICTHKPKYNLSIGSGSNTFQMHQGIQKLSDVLENMDIDYLITPGDTNSALIAALVGFKLDIPTCHLESGLRSYDMRMQEEINRRLIDHGSAGLFAPTTVAVHNLEHESVSGDIFLTGDTMYDILKTRLPIFKNPALIEKLRIDTGTEKLEYAVLTLHRRENVDDFDRMQSIIDALGKLSFPIIFPEHPRTSKKLSEFNLSLPSNVRVIEPISYDLMMALVDSAALLITDSGGLQKEAYLLDTPCVTIRDNTEWVETIQAGANILSLANSDDIIRKVKSMWGKKLQNDPSVYGDGEASQKIARIINSGTIKIKSNLMI